MTAASPPPDSAAAPSAEFTPWPYLAILLRHRRLLVVLPVLLAVGVSTYSLMGKRQFAANSRFIPQDGGQSNQGLGAVGAQLGINLPGLGGGNGSSSSPAFYGELVKSNAVLRDVMSTRYKTPVFDGTLFDYFHIEDADSSRAFVRAARYTKEQLSVDVDRTTSMVRVEFRSTDQVLAVQVVRRLLQLINDYNASRRRSVARAEREFVGTRLAEIRDSLKRTEDDLAGFLRSNRNYQGSPQLAAEEQRLQRRVTIQQNLYLGLVQRFESARIDEVRDTPVITIVEPPEGFVQPVARGTGTKAFLALVAGLALALAWALVSELLGASRLADRGEFLSFEREWSAARDDLRRLTFRARRPHDGSND